MAEAPSVRSRSARSEGQSTARRQTGALHAAGVDYERLLPERGRQDHAGQQVHYLQFALIIISHSHNHKQV